MTTIHYIVLFAFCYFLLIKVLGFFQTKKRQKSNLNFIRNELSKCETKFHSIQNYFHPTFEVEKMLKEFELLKKTDLNNAEWNYYVFEKLKYKIENRFFDIDKFQNRQKLVDNFLSIKEKLTDKQRDNLESHLATLNKLASSPTFAYSIDTIAAYLNYIPVLLDYYQNKKFDIEKSLSNEYSNISRRIRSNYY